MLNARKIYCKSTNKICAIYTKVEFNSVQKWHEAPWVPSVDIFSKIETVIVLSIFKIWMENVSQWGEKVDWLKNSYFWLKMAIFTKSTLLSIFLFRGYQKIFLLLNILMMLNKIIIWWCWIRVSTSCQNNWKTKWNKQTTLHFIRLGFGPMRALIFTSSILSRQAGRVFSALLFGQFGQF